LRKLIKLHPGKKGGLGGLRVVKRIKHGKKKIRRKTSSSEEILQKGKRLENQLKVLGPGSMFEKRNRK